MDLPLNSVLNLTKEEIKNSKIEFNMQAGSGEINANGIQEVSGSIPLISLLRGSS